MLRLNNKILVLGQLALTILFVGCNLFTTRDPELPTGVTGSGWQFPSSPEQVLENLENALGSRSNVDYLRSFATGDNEHPGFLFLADAETEKEYPGRFDQWNYAREQKFAESLFNPVIVPLDSIVAFSYQIERETFIGDSSRITGAYELRIGHQLQEVPQQLAGRCELTLRRGDDGGWQIFRWADFRVAGRPCISDLKAQF